MTSVRRSSAGIDRINRRLSDPRGSGLQFSYQPLTFISFPSTRGSSEMPCRYPGKRCAAGSYCRATLYTTVTNSRGGRVAPRRRKLELMSITRLKPLRVLLRSLAQWKIAGGSPSPSCVPFYSLGVSLRRSRTRRRFAIKEMLQQNASSITVTRFLTLQRSDDPTRGQLTLSARRRCLGASLGDTEEEKEVVVVLYS
ncbi:unnamed protein product [Pleuronectes platessa]|uniref:Uncharacterized protein n=1 Tax=Pleuronectes platessa TaxID=8262 RepID=A0A9N7Z7E1_PLEPL|nr:unnamed protein product [Pleuronectes platessa]